MSLPNNKLTIVIDNPTCADATVENSDASYSDSIASGGNLVLPDSQINVNGVDEGDVVSVKTINVTLIDSNSDPVTPTNVDLTGNDLEIEVPSGGSPSGIFFKPSGLTSQWTQYATAPNDDGELAQSTFYTDIVVPSYPKVKTQLDLSVGSNYWNRIKENLIVDGVSSKERFVDVDGVQTFTTSGNKDLVFIDKLTGYMWYRAQIDFTSRNFEDALTFADSHSVVIDGVTYDVWIIPTVNMWVDIMPQPRAVKIVDGAVTILTSQNGMSTSTTDLGTTTNYFRLLNVGFSSSTKTATARTFLVRKAHNLITAP
jgi:hypothetical protein